jgi:hypothetical protein
VVLALGTAAIVLVALLCELSRPRITRTARAALAGHRTRRAEAERALTGVGYDPGRELRAEQRARTLLRSCIDAEDWEMYRDLGFLRVWGGQAAGPGIGSTDEAQPAEDTARGAGPAGSANGAPPPDGTSPKASYAYLIYPHKPIVAYVPETGTPLNEYCVGFPDHSRPYGSARLPDSDDVLAKWMALTADERGLIEGANMHLPGRQIDPERIRRDLQRLARWERERAVRRTPASAPTAGTRIARHVEGVPAA